MRGLVIAILMVCLIFSAGNLTLADDKHSTSEKGPKVYCCHGKGDCDKIHTRAECEKEGGKVVDNCKECK